MLASLGIGMVLSVHMIVTVTFGMVVLDVMFLAGVCSGNIWTFREVEGVATDFRNRTTEINLGGGEFINYISSFGEDNDGELYFVDYNGAIYKLVILE